MSKLAPYRKSITSLITGIIGWVSAVLASSSPTITNTEWILLATIVAASAGVYAVPNAPTV